MLSKYVAPKYKLEGFTCPKCGSFSSQEWYVLYHNRKDTTLALPDYKQTKIIGSSSGYVGVGTGYFPETINDYFKNFTNTDALSLSRCYLCKSFCLWEKDKLIYPTSNNAPLPNSDIPDDVKEDFLEARNIVELSPRSSSALLRLALQKLLKHLDCKGDDLNYDIGQLVKKGLPIEIQKSLDIVRVIGNESVHPGTLDLKDDRETAMALFNLLNLIVSNRITQPKEIDALYSKLPPIKLNGIKDRDKKK